MPAPRTPGRVTYVVAIVDFDSQATAPTAVPGLEITVCPSNQCNQPSTAPDVVITNPLPNQPPFVYAIEVPYSYSNASLRLTAPNYAEMDYYFGGPLIGTPEGVPPDGGGSAYRVTGLAIPLLKTSTRDFIYYELGAPTPADETRGVLAVRTLNCLRGNPNAPQGTRAASVSLHSIADTPPPPAVAWTLSFSNTPTKDKLVTDNRGVAGFIDLLPGVYVVEGVAPVGPNGAPYGQTPLLVRANVITLAEIRDGLDQWGQ